jgi:hypothetical protein
MGFVIFPGSYGNFIQSLAAYRRARECGDPPNSLFCLVSSGLPACAGMTVLGQALDEVAIISFPHLHRRP